MSIFQNVMILLLTEITAAQNEVALSCHRVPYFTYNQAS